MSVYLWLMAAAFCAGAINSVAGGGSFITFPALVMAGVPAVISNASNTVALAPGTFASALSYRGDIRRLQEKHLKAWFVTSLFGGAAGAGLLLVTSDKTFREIAPWLLLFATVLFTFGARLNAVLRGRLQGNEALMICMLIPISIYGGYFGGGIGIMFLAAFRLYGLTDIHGMNGVKTLLSCSLNTVASVVFAAAHQVAWGPAVVMMTAGIAGGYLGPVMARRTKPVVIRGIVIVVGTAMTLYFFRIAPH